MDLRVPVEVPVSTDSLPKMDPLSEHNSLRQLNWLGPAVAVFRQSNLNTIRRYLEVMCIRHVD